MDELLNHKGGRLLPREMAGLRVLGAEVRRARLSRGWSQRGLERASHVDQTTISRLENGRLRSLRLVRLASLIEALGSEFRIDVPLSPRDAKDGIAPGGT